ncbi:MAG: Omp28 family outer membrane lipoprotein [Bacteroidota bacterium]
MSLQNAYRSLLLLTLCLLAQACTEIPPVINPIGNVEPIDTDEVVRKVLIEEFTGVRCVNCPAGTAEVLTLKEAYGERLVAVALHAGIFANPYSDSQEAFEIAETRNLLTYLGSPLGYPTAVVNRQLFPDERDLQLTKSLWAPFIQQASEDLARVKIDLSVNYDSADRSVQVNINATALEDILESPVSLSVMVVEDNVQDVQLTPDGKKSDYNHRHNLRDMLTAFNGNPLEAPIIANSSLLRNYFYTLPEVWVAENCSIVAFVHFDGEMREVLQVEEVKLLR